MKTIISLLTIAFLATSAFGFADPKSDTVVIKLDNDTKIVIYTNNKADLRSIEKYDLNKMVQDLNNSVSKSNSEYVLIEDNDGRAYLKDTTVVYNDGKASASVRLGNMELSVDDDDIEDFDDIERAWDRDDDFRSYSYIDRDIDRTRNYFNFELGTNNWLIDGTTFPNESNEPFSVRPWGSWYVGLFNNNKTWVGGPIFIDWGFGVSFYNWKFEDDSFQAVRGDDMIEFRPPAANITPEKSKLAASYVNFNFVPMFDFARGRKKVRAVERGSFSFKRSRKDGLRFGGGGYVGYRIGSRSKFLYKDENGNNEKDLNKGNFYLTNLRYGIRAQMGYKGMDFFANYDLNEVFATDRGPKLNAISFGIVF